MSVQVQLRRDITTNVQANKGVVGEVFVDTTVNRLVVQDGTTNGGWPTPITLSVQNSGSTNNSSSGSGTYVSHTPTFTIPANFMTAARAFRVSAHFQMTTGSAPPNLNHRLVLGSSVLGVSTAFAPSASLTNVGFGMIWMLQATAAPSGSTNVLCTIITGPTGGIAAQVNAVGQPIAIATNAAQAITLATQWSAAGTGTNTITLNQLIVEALN